MINENNFIRLDQDLTDQMTVNKNLSQDIIVTNTDKVTILLNEHHNILKKKAEWFSPLGIFISVLTTLFTAKFDEIKLGLKPEYWYAIFVIVCVLSFLVSAYYIYQVFAYRKHGTIDEFIVKLKNQCPTRNQSNADTFNIGLVIDSAKYGAEGVFVDVKSKIVELTAKNIFEIQSNNELVDGKDPLVGKQKQLEIIYSINSSIHKRSPSS